MCISYRSVCREHVWERVLLEAVGRHLLSTWTELRKKGYIEMKASNVRGFECVRVRVWERVLLEAVVTHGRLLLSTWTELRKPTVTHPLTSPPYLIHHSSYLLMHVCLSA